jgi:hypothetical protein
MADESTALAEYTFCYDTVLASIATLDPILDADVILDINVNVLPAIQKVYDDSVAATTSYYASIESNILKKASGYATSTNYAATLTDGCNLVKDIRSGALFAKVKANVMLIATSGIKNVVSAIKSASISAIADATLMVDVSALDDAMVEVNKAAGMAAAMIGQGTTFLNATLTCMGSAELLSPNVAAGITEIRSLMAAGGGVIKDKKAALDSIKSKINTAADIQGKATATLGKLQNASYKIGI